MSAPTLPPLQVQRFRTDAERLIGKPGKLGIAVSGGPDSLALLLLACTAYPGQIEAATVDHGLRVESAEEARFVADLCGSLSVPHSTLRVEVAEKGEGLQGEARRARYAALATWAAERSIEAICTAHHADDQAETILMRLQRGSGIGGLAGIRALRRDATGLLVARPLLGWTRADLAGIVRTAGIVPVEDPSNRDERFDRVAMRQFLASNPQFKAERLARSAASLSQAEQGLQWMTGLLEAERCACEDDEWRIDAAGLPREMRRRLLARAIAAVRKSHSMAPEWTGAEDVENLLQVLEAGGKATLAGTVAEADAMAWRVRLAPPRRR